MNAQIRSWWSSFSLEEKFYHTISWLKSQGRNVTERHPNDLTDYEIKAIFYHVAKGAK